MLFRSQQGLRQGQSQGGNGGRSARGADPVKGACIGIGRASSPQLGAIRRLYLKKTTDNRYLFIKTIDTLNIQCYNIDKEIDYFLTKAVKNFNKGSGDSIG